MLYTATVFTAPGSSVWRRVLTSPWGGATRWLWKPWTMGLPLSDGKGFPYLSGAEIWNVITFPELLHGSLHCSLPASFSSIILFTTLRRLSFLRWQFPPNAEKERINVETRREKNKMHFVLVAFKDKKWLDKMIFLFILLSPALHFFFMD